MSIRVVDFKIQRHKKNGKRLIDDTCFVIEELDNAVAGYAVVAWDDAGHTSIAFKSGGPVAGGYVHAHVGNKLLAATKMAAEDRKE